MIYENYTFELILKRMLDCISDNADKREGSLIYAAIAPAAAELMQMYIELQTILNETFADTASRESLIKRASERGIVPGKATNAVFKGLFNIDVPIGSRYSIDDLNYIATEKISDGIFKLQCEKPGRSPNNITGTLVPIEYIQDLAAAELTEVLIPGEDEEDTEHLRKRYFDSLDSKAFGGNMQDYKDKVNALNGVGGVKVYPVWNGGGSVKIVFTNSDYSVPSAELVTEIQTAIDPVQNKGKGFGIAPIGHIVTVLGVSFVIVNIRSAITYQEGWNWEAVKPYTEAAMDEYLKELCSVWADNDSIIVRISQIETRFLGLPGVVDITGTTINGTEQNLVLGADELPKRGTLNG